MIAACLTILLMAIAHGQAEEKDHVANLSEIIVTAPRLGVGESDVIGSVSIARESISRTVEGLLDNYAGIDLARRSFAGSDSRRLSIRGFDESRSLIMLNDCSMHGAGVYGGYYVDWVSLSIEDIEKVELTRGMVPVKYGNTLGGVINIVTAKGSENQQTHFRAGGGSLGTYDVQVKTSGKAGVSLYSLAAGHYDTDGYLRNAFVDRDIVSGRISSYFGDSLTLKAGGRYTESKNGMVVYNMPDAWSYDSGKPDSLDAQLGGPFIQFLQPHSGSFDWGESSYMKDRRLNVDMGLLMESDDFNFSFTVFLIDQEREEYFYAVDDADHLILQRDSRPEKNNWGWNAAMENELGAGSHYLEYGAEGHYLGYGGSYVKAVDPVYFSAMPYDSPNKKNPITQFHGIYLQDTYEITDALQVQAGLRTDLFRADGSEENAPTINENKTVPRIAMTARPWKGGRVIIQAGQTYRFPTNPEYYWWYSGYQPANREDLTSERANQYQVEVGHSISDRLDVNARTYYYDVDNYIRTIFGYRPSRVVYNVDNAEFMGAELEVSYRISDELTVWSNFTHQNTKKHGDILDNSMHLTDKLAELPDNKANAGVSYKKDKGLTVNFKVGYVDKRWQTMGNLAMIGGSYLAELDGYIDVDLQVGYPVYCNDKGREVRIELAAENILNQDIVEEYGYPMPGTTFMAGLSASF